MTTINKKIWTEKAASVVWTARVLLNRFGVADGTRTHDIRLHRAAFCL